jgi:long-chain acyl-CoA synthetase
MWMRSYGLRPPAADRPDRLTCPSSHGGRKCATTHGVIDHLHQAWNDLTAPGAPFAMTRATIRGVDMKVFAAAPPSMRTVWEMTAPHAERDYLVYEDERYTYAEVSSQVRALAAHLQSAHNVGVGDRVAIAMRNYPEWVVAYWATICIGAAVVGMNAWWTGPEMEYGLTDSAPKVLIADDERLARVMPHLESVRAQHPVAVISVRSDGGPADALRWADVVRADAAPATLPVVDIDPDSDACVFYTSGTTGFPKGAQLTHRGCVTNLMHLGFWAAAGQLAGAKAAAASGATATPGTTAAAPAVPCFVAPTPLFHVTANNCIMQPATLGGGKVVLMYKWDAGRALELIERERATNFSGVPTMSRELLAHPDWATRDTSSLAGMGGGGAALQPDLVAKIGKSLKSGQPSTGYGLTETCGIVTANSAAFFLAKPESCGPAMPTFDAKLVNEEGVTVTEGTGELWVKGPCVIRGYLNKAEATAEAIKEGWFATGDIAKIDDAGFIYIVDRAKDMVLRGGENVYCSEVETAIYQHDGVAEAAVFGMPDDRLGEEVAAAVLLHPGASLDEAGLQAFLAPLIAKYKVPARVWILDQPIPRNANGKFVKRELRKQLLGL